MTEQKKKHQIERRIPIQHPSRTKYSPLYVREDLFEKNKKKYKGWYRLPFFYCFYKNPLSH